MKLRIGVKKRVVFKIGAKKKKQSIVSKMTSALFKAVGLRKGLFLNSLKRKQTSMSSKKRLTITVVDTGIGCDYCLAKKALHYNQVFEQNLCKDCEDKLELALGAEAYERMKKK